MHQNGDIAAGARPLHVLNRLAFGPRPGDLENLRRSGLDRYIEQQLNPESIPVPAALDQRVAALRTLRMTPVDLFIEFRQPIREAANDDKDAKKALRQQARQVIMEAIDARIVRALYSPRQLQEVMTHFWFNHFNVFAGKGLCAIWCGAFEEEAIRPHTLGRFRDLLGATAKHPAMLFYLDNWQNTDPNSPGKHGKFEGINENYARELMELHTLGVNGGYSQADVIALAHILTGWGLVRGGQGAGMELRARPYQAGDFLPRGAFFPPFGFHPQRRPGLPPHNRPQGVMGRYGFFFDAGRHGFGNQSLLGRQIQGGGIEQGEQALDLLARSPATANHLSFQLAQYFIADNPPESLVSRMASRYLATDGNIRDVLAAMFASAEFRDPRCYGAKFKTPYEFVISAVRATGVEVVNTRPLAATMAQLGMPLYGCQTPDGYKNTQDAWLNPDAMMTRLSFATALGAGRLPLDRVPDDDLGGLAELRNAAGGRPVNNQGEMNTADPVQLAMTLGDLFTARTAAAVESAPAQLRAPLIVGSPEFMMR